MKLTRRSKQKGQPRSRNEQTRKVTHRRKHPTPLPGYHHQSALPSTAAATTTATRTLLYKSIREFPTSACLPRPLSPNPLLDLLCFLRNPRGFLAPGTMDSDYVGSLPMGSSSSAPGLDFVAPLLDGGFLETLCGGGGAGFAEREARVAGGGLYGVPAGNGELGGSREGSSVSDPAWAHARDANARKRKAPTGDGTGKGKEAFLSSSPCKVGEAKGPDSKKCKMEEGPVKPKVEETASDSSAGDRGQKQGKGKNSKPAVEPPKDYVHVRARRGQATDSHSLAERVRRERISQRMKVLQDLVPACNKVVGKALMLDEIINYVQSLQQQVEFLSMKLATVNPQLDISNLSTLLNKDMYQACGPSVSSIFPLEGAGAAFPFCDQAHLFQSFGSGTMENQCSLRLLDTALPHTANTQYAFQKQQRDLWEEDLQNALHIGNEQSQENGVSALNFDGSYNG